MLRIAQLVACFGVIVFSHSAIGWGPTGHMTVGTIADQMIAGTNAGKQVKKLLGSNLRTASVWADCAKGVSESTLQYGGDGRFPECAIYENDASKKQMVAFVKRNLTNCNPGPNDERCHRQYHYTDVAIQRDKYAKNFVGTSDHDIVSTISAAIAVLEGGTAPAPIRIVGKKEALRLLAHYLGDIHQPLHVTAVYLDTNGKVVDPDQGTFDPATTTKGGNDILDKAKKLHGEWDAVPDSLSSDNLLPAALVEARAVPQTPGAMSMWSTVWATETLVDGKIAFKDLTYSPEDAAHHYKVTFPPGYNADKAALQRQQIIRAGARLAQILTTIWP